MILKERLDVLLAQKGLFATREQAQRSVLAGEIWQGQSRLEKPGMRVRTDIAVEVRSRTPQYVSRGGFKLEHALQKFGMRIPGRVCLDIGSSTGGFTDCLLQKGARRVFAVDVGTGQLDDKLRRDPRVTSMEQVNARHLTPELLLAEHADAGKIDFLCADVSFISLHLLVPALQQCLRGPADWVLLFKPQFEVGPENVGKGGVVRSEEAALESLEIFDKALLERGLKRQHAPEVSPVPGKKSGNKEFLIHYEQS